MKIRIYLICCMLLLSCSASKIEEQVLNDFLKNQFVKTPYFKVVVDKPIKRIISLEYYEKAYQDRNIRLGDMIRIRPDSNPPFVWCIDTVEVRKLKENYKNDTISRLWRQRNFDKLQFKLADSKNIKSIKSYLSEKYSGSEAIEISRPLITTDKKHAFLFFRTFTVGISFGHSIQKAILMKNVDGKWKTIETYSEFGIIH